jgi:hypothetical protein
MKILSLLLIAIASCACCAASDVAEPKAAPPADWSRYEILVKRNIFAKDRGRAREERSEAKEKEAPPPPKPEAELALIGIVNKDGQLVAFIENTKTGTVQNVKEGEKIARGKIAAVTLDKITYELEDKKTEISIGSTLEGGTAGARSESVKTASGTSTSHSDTTSTGSSGGTDVNSVLERMRKKRQEALK